MERFIDFLEEELKAEKARKDATNTRKAGKHARVAEMMKKLAKAETPIPVLDFLGD
jgi:hypothetical protein